MITDDEAYAEKVGEETWGITKVGEQKMKDKADEEEAKLREEEAKKQEGKFDCDKVILVILTLLFTIKLKKNLNPTKMKKTKTMMKMTGRRKKRNIR